LTASTSAGTSCTVVYGNSLYNGGLVNLPCDATIVWQAFNTVDAQVWYRINNQTNLNFLGCGLTGNQVQSLYRADIINSLDASQNHVRTYYLFTGCNQFVQPGTSPIRTSVPITWRISPPNF
jgi:hypothetical protein